MLRPFYFSLCFFLFSSTLFYLVGCSRLLVDRLSFVITHFLMRVHWNSLWYVLRYFRLRPLHRFPLLAVIRYLLSSRRLRSFFFWTAAVNGIRKHCKVLRAPDRCCCRPTLNGLYIPLMIFLLLLLLSPWAQNHVTSDDGLHFVVAERCYMKTTAIKSYARAVASAGRHRQLLKQPIAVIVCDVSFWWLWAMS